MKHALSFDDVLLVPKYSEVLSRTKVETETFLTKTPDLKLKIPIISSPMTTVTEDKMAQALADVGGVGVIHRFHSGEGEDEMCGIKEQVEQVKKVKGLKGFALGINGLWQTRVELNIEAGADFAMIDIAHGNQIRHLEVIKEFKKRWPHFPLIGGNVADGDGVRNLCDAGVDGIRVGVGGGSLCTTRVMTGFGVPSITSLQLCRKVIDANRFEVTLIQDGGIRFPADLVKSIAAGADAVILGGLFAGCIESPAKPNYNPYTRQFESKYMGSASAAAKGKREFIEGAEKTVPVKGEVSMLIQHLVEGLQSGLSYAGAHNLKQLRENAEFIQITQNGLNESHPHLLYS